MSQYHPIYTDTFQKRLKQYGSMRERARKRAEKILADPYDRTEILQENLKGLRSARIGRNFRIIFAVSEEVKSISVARHAFPEFCNHPDHTVIFITVGTHDKAYDLK